MYVHTSIYIVYPRVVIFSIFFYFLGETNSDFENANVGKSDVCLGAHGGRPWVVILSSDR